MSKQWYEEYQEKLHDEQDGKSREEIAEDLQQHTEHVFDPDNAPKQGHKWVDRGLKMSCEHAGHAMHQAWKVGGKHVTN